MAFKPNERNIFFHILTACNLSCEHCYINVEQHGKETVSRETMKEWLSLFMDPQKESNVIFLGGEPTLHPDLPFGIRTARELGYHSITVDSNGFLFHDFLERIRPDEIDYLSFSLDGPTAEVNDPIRGKGVYATCTENIRRAVEKGFHVSLIYTVSRLNIESLQLMPELLTRLGIKRFFIQVIGLRGKSAVDSTDNLQVAPDEWLSIIPDVAVNAAAMGIHVTYPKVFLAENEEFQCAGNVAENYFIFPNGRVYLCPLCEDFPINTFTIKDHKLIENPGLVEEKFFSLNIQEGCVMNKLLQPGNLAYDEEGNPTHRISCCLLKQEIQANS